MVNEIQECQMLFEHRTEMDKCIVLHQHFYQIIHEKTFLMKFDESQQKFDEIWPNNILMSRQKICTKSIIHNKISNFVVNNIKIVNFCSFFVVKNKKIKKN